MRQTSLSQASLSQLYLTFDAPAATAGAPDPVKSRAARTIDERFAAFHKQNPQVYREVVRRALALRAGGCRHYSIDHLLQEARMDGTLTTTGEGAKPGQEFKINNDFTSRYARKAMTEHPALAGLFKTRPLKDEKMGGEKAK